ncbi:acetate kinase [Rippkaea orientalis PCC 8801]|uniref:Acetate kinase n=1 Tax=Rippkaea orientalis (strain PCC 8801 / RF-1) TaxID=41431 RepID=ACKA_RIPO1|nr:acetate kinase [Rippkaea orientalis]B7K4D0.1 RecName: Full=Acetate kinase; AltName: Full=Acetokinase [Rippkaea orientalis PCC 8801]ACK67836.1 acetate kinase [Rippkaea orientalis PCC 8801]
MKILILNAGSSSQKSCLYDFKEKNFLDNPVEPIWKADIDWTLATGQGILTVKANGIKQKITLNSDDHHHGIAKMLGTLVEGKTKVIQHLSDISIVGHRVVHGGTDYSEATLITPDVKATIARLIPLAPTHNPSHLEGIEAIEQVLGNIPQVAVFDTAFHSQMPLEASVYPIPYEWLDKGIRRYGFHGTSHKYCAEKASQLLNKPLTHLKLITCHLGNGCSLAAIKNGISIDTTMGFTPLEGLMMGTRSGSIDPAILIYLMREYDFTFEQLNEMLNQESGLKGVSGISADLRAIFEAINQGNDRAQLALDMYLHRLRSQIGSMLASLGGLDALIFTAGIGENAAIVREKACQGFSFLGLKLDLEKNANSPVNIDISTPDSTVRILVIHTQEDWAIAQECCHWLNK